MRKQALLLCVGVGLLFTGCMMDEPAEDVEKSAHGVRVASDAEAQREAVAIYNELAARLRERRVSLADLEAAARAGDESAVRAMLGYSAQEVEALVARVEALAESLKSPESDDPVAGGGPSEPFGPPRHRDKVRCDWFWTGACIARGMWDYGRLGGAVGLALAALWGVGCVGHTCRLEGGTWTQVP